MANYYFKTEISELLNPPLCSKYFQKQNDSIEDLYLSRQKAPLGRCRVPDIPSKYLERSFGIPTSKDISAADLMHPSRSQVYQSVYSEVFHYRKPVDCIRPAGITEGFHDDTGEQMKGIFEHKREKNSAIILPSSYVHKFDSHGISVNKQSLDKNHELQKNAVDKQVNEAKGRKSKKSMRDRNFVETLWNLLKMKNHSNFKDLISAFRAYQSGDNNITVSDLKKMCQKLGISTPLHVMEQLLEECDIIDKDGAISYEEFIHCLNWKDLLPENSNFKTFKYANDWREGINNPSEDITGQFKTVSSFVGDHKYSVNSRAAGLQSYSKEVDKSKLRGVAEFNELGDASSVLQPNSFLKYGVFEEDLKVLYPKEKLKEIINKCGIKFSEEAFEIIWENVNQNRKASIGAVWNGLKNLCLFNFRDL